MHSSFTILKFLKDIDDRISDETFKLSTLSSPTLIQVKCRIQKLYKIVLPFQLFFDNELTLKDIIREAELKLSKVTSTPHQVQELCEKNIHKYYIFESCAVLPLSWNALSQTQLSDNTIAVERWVSFPSVSLSNALFSSMMYDIWHFDYLKFKMSIIEACNIDPQQRLLLDCTQKARLKTVAFMLVYTAQSSTPR